MRIDSFHEIVIQKENNTQNKDISLISQRIALPILDEQTVSQ